MLKRASDCLTPLVFAANRSVVGGNLPGHRRHRPRQRRRAVSGIDIDSHSAAPPRQWVPVRQLLPICQSLQLRCSLGPRQHAAMVINYMHAGLDDLQIKEIMTKHAQIYR